MENLKLCESDHRFMQVVWQHQPVSSGQLVTLCSQHLGWKKPTTYTVLRKLCERGLLQNKDTIVTALVPQEAVDAYQSDYFVERTFEGSLPRFLTAFLGGRVISPSEAEELKQLIDAHKEG